MINCINAYNSPCSSCKWFIPNKTYGYSLCGFYKETHNILGKDVSIYEFTTHCRNNEDMCGTEGRMYEYNDETYDITSPELNEKYKELKNRCCGEVNENSDIEQLEKDMFEVMQKIKKHNTRNIYRTTKDLYKLFKRSPS